MSGRRLVGLCEAAAAVESQRRSNPINGDGSNYALTQAIDAIARLAGDDKEAVIEAAMHVRRERQQADEDRYQRMRAEEAALNAARAAEVDR